MRNFSGKWKKGVDGICDELSSGIAKAFMRDFDSLLAA